jgi:hypothetical protein
MLYAGLDLSRHRLDVHLMNQAGEPVLFPNALKRSKLTFS